MKIALINGSPKLGAKSNSGMMLNWLKSKIEPSAGTGSEHIFNEYAPKKQPLTNEQFAELCTMDAIVLSFPLYVDAIPSHLFRMMAAFDAYRAESLKKKEAQKEAQTKDIFVYAIVNNGFFEGAQSHIALRIIENWCARSGLVYGQGIGQGAGEMMGFLSRVPLGHGPLKNLGGAFDILSANILAQKKGENLLFSPNFPYISWRMMATNFYWKAQAKRNGLKVRDIENRPAL